MIQGGAKLQHLCGLENSAYDTHCLWKSQRAEQMDIVKLAIQVQHFDENCDRTFWISFMTFFLVRLAQIAETGTRAQAQYLASIRNGNAREDCLVDTWIGHARHFATPP